MAIKSQLALIVIASLLFIDAMGSGSTEGPILTPWDMPPIGVVPDVSIKHWLKYNFVSPLNQPTPTVLISTQHVKTAGTWLIELPPGMYGNMDEITRTAIANTKCLLSPPDADSVVIMVQRHSAHRTEVCEMMQEPFCSYLADILRSAQIHESVGDLSSAQRFGRFAGCKSTP